MDKPGQVKKEKRSSLSSLGFYLVRLGFCLSGPSRCGLVLFPQPPPADGRAVQYAGGTVRFERQGDRFRAATGLGKLVRGAEPSHIRRQTSSGEPVVPSSFAIPLLLVGAAARKEGARLVLLRRGPASASDYARASPPRRERAALADRPPAADLLRVAVADPPSRLGGA
jgi:hypothetical protein